MNLLRRHFLGSSLVVLGSSLLRALTTPLWKWRSSIRLDAATLPDPSISNSPPTVKVIIEKSEAAALGFNDVFLVIGAAPDIGNGQAGLASYVDELNRRRWR